MPPQANSIRHRSPSGNSKRLRPSRTLSSSSTNSTLFVGAQDIWVSLLRNRLPQRSALHRLDPFWRAAPWRRFSCEPCSQRRGPRPAPEASFGQGGDKSPHSKRISATGEPQDSRSITWSGVPESKAFRYGRSEEHTSEL